MKIEFPKRFLACLLLSAATVTSADEAALAPEAVSSLSIAGNAGAPTVTAATPSNDTIFLRARDFASGAIRSNLAYLRFDLSALSNPSIQSATLTLNRVGRDGLSGSRVALYGLDDLPGNTPQNWDTSAFAPGAEFDLSMFLDNVASSDRAPVNLAQLSDFSSEERLSGSRVTLDSENLVAFLQERADADGLATLLLAMPSQGTSDKVILYASRLYADDAALRPTLDITYFDSSLPSPPENLSVFDIEFAVDPTLQLTWDAVDGALQYRIYKRTGDEDTPTLIGISGNTAFVDSDVALLGEYAYSIAVTTDSGDSIQSPELAVTIIDTAAPFPTRPANLALSDATPESISLDWDDSDSALLYEIMRSTQSDRGFEYIGNSESSAFTDTNGIDGFQTYFYLVNAIGAGGMSPYSAPFQAGPRFDENSPRPFAPRNLSIDERESFTATLSWSPSEHAEAYQVFRSARKHGDYYYLATTEDTTFSDSYALYPESNYFYKVAAVGPGGISRKSDKLVSAALLRTRRQMENLDRAPIAKTTDEGIFLSWRLLGTDSGQTAFILYRNGKRITKRPIKGATNYVDAYGDANSHYTLLTLKGSHSQPSWDTFGVSDEDYHSIPLQIPTGGQTPDGVDFAYSANDASIADLDGDKELEIVLKWDPSNSKDNAHSGNTGNVILDAYELDGTHLWRIDLGRNIRAGAHYTQFMVYDLDGDGKAEVVCKTADATTDAAGTVIGDPAADHRNASGYILEGPEYLTAFDGQTGRIIDTVDYVPQRGAVIDWGDSYGNRVDRFLAGIAYFDGQRPSYFAARGQYRGQGGTDGRTVIAAFDLIDRKLVQRWVLDSVVDGREWAGQGHHQLSVGDVDSDGKDEILYGGMVIDDNGKGLYSTELGTGDALHFGDLDPSRPGRELAVAKEESGRLMFIDPANGSTIWEQINGRDTGRGLTADINPLFPGEEAWGAANLNVRNAQGDVIGTRRPSINFATWWDGDAMRELTDGNSIRKWNVFENRENTLLEAVGASSNNGTKATPTLQADILGDWREEVILRSSDNTELRIYTTTDLTDIRMPTLLHDPVYRLSIAWQNNGYNQPPHPSFFIGNNMPPAPEPNLFVSPIPDIYGKRDDNGNYTGTAIVSIDTAKNAGLRHAYQINDGTWRKYKHPFPLYENGDYEITFRIIDSDGETLAERATSIRIDRPRNWKNRRSGKRGR